MDKPQSLGRFKARNAVNERRDKPKHSQHESDVIGHKYRAYKPRLAGEMTRPKESPVAQPRFGWSARVLRSINN
jgi:hypothetical protein